MHRILNINENDYYQVLNVDRNASEYEIRNAYKKRVLEFHPDKNVGRLVDTTEVFKVIKRAYETLSDATRKQDYDVDLDVDRDKDNDDDNDDFSFAKSSNSIAIHMGDRMSDIYQKEINEYIAQYETMTFIDNFTVRFYEILKTFRSTFDEIYDVDNYVQCKVCHQTSLDERVHRRQNVEPYEDLFKDSTLITFEQIIDPSIWDWKSVRVTSIYLAIWNSNQQWNQMKQMCEYVRRPVEILQQSFGQRYWSAYVDRYNNEKQTLSVLPEILSHIKFIDFVPDSKEILELKHIFDRYDQNEDMGLLTKLKIENDQRTSTGNSYCLVAPTTKHKYIDINDFTFPIEDPPATKENAAQCTGCNKPFSFITRRHTCRMCGEQYCSSCLLFKRIPYLGYIVKPVRLCIKCSEEKEKMIYDHLFVYVKTSVESNRNPHINIYLALVYQYKSNGNELFYRQTGNHYYHLRQYSLALQCYTYARIDSDEWFQFATDLCTKQEYSYAFTCMKLCQKSNAFWLNEGQRTSNPIFAILCYERIKLSIEQLFEVVCCLDTEDIDTCMLYILYMNYKYSNIGPKWKNLAENFLLKETTISQHGDMLMLLFHLCNTMSIDDWRQIAEQLSRTKQFEKLTYLLSYLHGCKMSLSVSTDRYIRGFTKISQAVPSTTILLDDWLNEICLSTDICDISVDLSLIHTYQYSSWDIYKQQYIDQKQYYKVLLCHKMVEQFSVDDHKYDTSWLINGIEDQESIAFELFDGINKRDWKLFGDKYFNQGNFTVALNCYLQCQWTRANEIILEKAYSYFSKSLLYYITVYKRLSGNNHKVRMTLNRNS